MMSAKPMSDGAAENSPAAPSTFQPIVLSFPVGEGFKAKNKFDDVIAIQRGFNKLLPEDRGFLAPLVDDGICGPKTKKAIHSFQMRHFGFSGADTLMEPGKQTINKLNELIRTKAFTPATLEDFAKLLGLPAATLQGAISGSMSLARDWIRSTHMRLVTPLPYPLLNKYFLLDKQPSPAQARQQVLTIFQRMKTFFDRPGGLWGEAAFVPEPVIRTTDTTAWCIPGGYFESGISFIPVKSDANLVPIRNDAIYYTFRFIMQPSINRAYAIVHELGHFVSKNPPITDKVYAHKDFAAFNAMSPKDRLSNTDHYTMLAYEQGTGEATPPVGL